MLLTPSLDEYQLLCVWPQTTLNSSRFTHTKVSSENFMGPCIHLGKLQLCNFIQYFKTRKYTSLLLKHNPPDIKKQNQKTFTVKLIWVKSFAANLQGVFILLYILWVEVYEDIFHRYVIDEKRVQLGPEQ